MADAQRIIQTPEADLAPGDSRSRTLDTSHLEIAAIHSAADPLFTIAYDKLWAEFGAAHEMESREVIERRLGWHPVSQAGNCWLRYEMILVRLDDTFVAVRDHTAAVIRRAGAVRAIVHLSHVLVDAAWRRTGLAGWLRAWPLQTARACLAAASFPPDTPVTLVAEMEHPDERHPGRMIRLKAYEKAGFRKVDPRAVQYFQPDFRPAAEIDASGGPKPLPFGLIIRRVGREQELVIHGEELRAMVEALYAIYAPGFRQADMAVACRTLDNYPEGAAQISLVPPTQ